MLDYKYTWSRNWVAPFESLWSLLNKFAFFNNVNLQDAENLFHAPGHQSATWKTWNLNKISSTYLDENKICKILNLKSDERQKCDLSYLIPSDDIEFLTSFYVLRYCPVCIEHGYHSIFHQIYLIIDCPIHGINLIQKCPKCKKYLPYDLYSLKKIFPYTCRFCQYEFRVPHGAYTNIDPYRLNGLNIDEFHVDKMNNIFNWLKTLMNSSISIPRITMTRSDENNIDFIKNNKHDIINCCTTLFGNILPDDETKLKRGRVLIHSIIQYFRRIPTKESVQHLYNVDAKQLILIYKSIRRHFSKLVNIRHKLCVRETKYKILLGELGKISCYKSFGLLSWKRYWDSKIIIRKPHICYTTWFSPLRMMNNLKFNNPEEERWIISKLFADDCFWTFIQCILLSRLMRIRCNFNLDFISDETKRCMSPYWAIQVNSSSQDIMLHRWQKSNHLKVLGRIESTMKAK